MRTQLKIDYYFCNCSFPCGSAGKESACNARVPGFNPWVGKIPWKKGKATHFSFLVWRIP